MTDEEAAKHIAIQMDHAVLCPVCSDRVCQQAMFLYANDLNPGQTTLFCPHCDLEVTVKVEA